MWSAQEGCRAVFGAFRRAFCFCGASFVGRKFRSAWLGKIEAAFPPSSSATMPWIEHREYRYRWWLCHPLWSVFRQGMMFVLKIYRPAPGVSRIPKSACSFPIRQEQDGGAGEAWAPKGKRKTRQAVMAALRIAYLLPVKECLHFFDCWIFLWKRNIY